MFFVFFFSFFSCVLYLSPSIYITFSLFFFKSSGEGGAIKTFRLFVNVSYILKGPFTLFWKFLFLKVTLWRILNVCSVDAFFMINWSKPLNKLVFIAFQLENFVSRPTYHPQKALFTGFSKYRNPQWKIDFFFISPLEEHFKKKLGIKLAFYIILQCFQTINSFLCMNIFRMSIENEQRWTYLYV